jgi:hypothetical protein
VLVTACQPGAIPGRGAGAVKFEDDLSAYRPQYEVEKPVSSAAETPTAANVRPVNDVTQKLNTVLDTIAVRNKNVRYAQGYRVQVYSGNNREEAGRARDRSYTLFPDLTPYMVYTQPTFRVKVGDFIDRLEAQRVYAGLLADFPNAMVVQDRIEIR